MASIFDMTSWASALDVRVAALEAAQEPIEDASVESRRERNGRLLYLEICLMRNSNVPVWDDTTSRQLRDNYITVAERFLVQVQPPSSDAETMLARIDDLKAWLTEKSDKMRIYSSMSTTEPQSNREWLSGARVAFDETLDYLKRRNGSSVSPRQGVDHGS